MLAGQEKWGTGVQAAQERLAATYAWFTEGFATVNIQEAQQLLTALCVETAGVG